MDTIVDKTFGVFDTIPDRVWVAVDVDGAVILDTIMHEISKPDNELLPFGWGWVSVTKMSITK
jgi:hypothetical protein